MTNSVVFVAVSYFGAADAALLAGSLQGNSDQGWRLVVVDNSQDPGEKGLLDRLAGGDERISIVVAPTNLGYLHGARFALATMSEPAPTWLVVCNTDVTVATDFVGLLAERPADVVLAPSIASTLSHRDQNPYLLTRPGRRRVALWRLEFCWAPLAKLLVYLAALPRAWHSAQGGTLVPGLVYAPHGACFALPRVYFEEGATLDHPPFLFAEEITVAEECRRVGLSVRYDPALRVEHREHAATGRWRSTQMIRWQRESIRYVARVLRDRPRAPGAE